MVWLLFVHISALVIWAASLLILPPLIRYSQLQLTDMPKGEDAIDRLWFTRLASPVALLTIISGTCIFVMQRDYGNWLLVKLTVVTALVICHVLSGLLILTRQNANAIGLKCAGLFATILLLLLCIIILVLLKPDQDMLLWFF